MLSAYREIENLTNTVRAYSNNPSISTALDEILTLCSPYMETTENMPGEEYALTPGEQRVFALLLKRRGNPVTKDAILTACKTSEDTVAKVAEVRICNIRKKIPAHYQIDTIWGVGYRLAA